MKAKLTEESFLAQATKQLDESAAALDGETSSRLTRARQRALSELDRLPGFWPRWSLAAGVLASALVLVLAIGLTRQPSPEDVSGFEDLELLSANESFELFEELEFYEWLPAEQETG